MLNPTLPDIDTVIQVARKAGESILPYYLNQAEKQVSLKLDHSPLTAADQASHDILIKELSALGPWPVVSEESVEELSAKTLAPEIFWLVDPLDGTREFIKGSDEFSINVALIHKAFPILSVMVLPGRDLATYWSIKNKGAYGADNQRLYHYKPERAPIAGCSRSHISPRTLAYLEELNVETLIPLGSALKLIFLAEGKIDIYPRFEGSSGWDTAAGQLIAEEAGCVVKSVETGERLSYHWGQWRNSTFIAQREDWPITF